MADVDELQQAKQWISDSLLGDAELVVIVSTRIWADQRDPAVASPFPYVLFNYMGGTDSQGLGVVRSMSSLLFQVRVVCDGPPSVSTKKAAYRIDVVLQNTSAEISGDFQFSARREQPIDRPEYDRTQHRYHNLGGLYRLWIGANG